MKKTNILTKILSLLFYLVLIAAFALSLTACGNPTAPPTSTTQTVVGEGTTEFLFKVVDLDGKETIFTVKTNETTVGAALLKVNLIAGDTSEYGLYVKTVNGITLDYNKDNAYWSFYENDEYAQKGVDSTQISAGVTYMFKAEKA